MSDLNDIIVLWTETYGYQPKEAADRLGIHRSHLSRLLNYSSPVTSDILKRVAEDIDCSFERLLFAYMLMDDHLDRLERDPCDGFDNVLQRIHNGLRIHRRANEKHSIARAVLACKIGADLFDGSARSGETNQQRMNGAGAPLRT